MFLLYGMLGSPSQCASPLQCSPHWCFWAEASGVLPTAHHKFLSQQQEQQLEYFSEAASALRYICYFGGGEGEGQLILKCNLLPPGVHWELLTWICGTSVFLGFSCPCFPYREALVWKICLISPSNIVHCWDQRGFLWNVILWQDKRRL